MYYVYVLRNSSGQLYIGFTSDLNRRVGQHQKDEGGWTRRRGPWELVHYEIFEHRVEALQREKNLKRERTNKELRERFGSKKRPSLEGLTARF